MIHASTQSKLAAVCFSTISYNCYFQICIFSGILVSIESLQNLIVCGVLFKHVSAIMKDVIQNAKLISKLFAVVKLNSFDRTELDITKSFHQL